MAPETSENHTMNSKTNFRQVCAAFFQAGIASLLLSVAPVSAANEQVIGVTEPEQEVDLSFPESGTIRVIAVEEGARVKAGAVLAQLDCRVHETRLKIAKIRAASQAEIKSATAKLRMNERRLAQLEKLAAQGSANEDELARARADFAIAESELELAREAAAEAKLQAQQIEAEIEQRTLRSPVDGIVARISPEVAETVSPADGSVISVVSLGRLDLVIHVDHRLADGLKTGQKIPVRAADRDITGQASIEFVSPVTDASSGTVRIRLSLENGDGRHQSGVKYAVQLPTGAAPK